MKRLVFVILVSSLLVTLAFVQKENIPAVKASSLHQGDLILTGNNVTVIENERFDINGSIIIEENATLILRNAVLNFTRLETYESNMTLRNPANGNPRLVVENATITTDNLYYQRIHLYGNSSASINKLTTLGQILLHLHDYSVASISNSTMRFMDLDGYSVADMSDSVLSMGIITYGSSNLRIHNTTLNYLYVRNPSNAYVSNSTINDNALSVATSVNCSVSRLQPGHIDYWNFMLNCTVEVAYSSSAPNFTMSDTQVGGWSFNFHESSNATISNSELYSIRPDASSVVTVYSCSFSYAVDSCGNSRTHVYDSVIDHLFCHWGSPKVWLVNSTSKAYSIEAPSEVYVCWYLDVHVIDLIGQNVPSANVTATYPNATIAESKLTEANGWSRLTLMEKMKNATGEYPVGNYTVEATYGTHSNSITVNMTGNKQITLALDFVIPEFPSFLILHLFMIATLLAVIVYRIKPLRKLKCYLV